MASAHLSRRQAITDYFPTTPGARGAIISAAVVFRETTSATGHTCRWFWGWRIHKFQHPKLRKGHPAWSSRPVTCRLCRWPPL